jgi:hypothetical protein
MAVHVAYVGLVPVDATGNIVVKNSSTIKTMMLASTEHRVLYDATYAPNGAGTPTIAEYLTLEDAGGFNLVLMDQYMIITSDA